MSQGNLKKPLSTLTFSRDACLIFLHLISSFRGTTRPQLLVLAPPPLPLPLLSSPQTTPRVPHTSWPRFGFVMSGGCRTARAWMKSVKHVEVGFIHTMFATFLVFSESQNIPKNCWYFSSQVGQELEVGAEVGSLRVDGQQSLQLWN